MLLDDTELAPSAAAREHLAGCELCADRRRVLTRYSSRVSSLIAEVDLPAGFRYPTLPVAQRARSVRSSWTERHWRRAAVVLFVVGSLAAVPQLRAWTVGWVARQIAALTGAGGRDTPRVAPGQGARQAPAIDSGATLWFDADGSELAVEVANPQASGTLTFAPSTRPMTGVEIVNGEGETPLVREHGVRIINGHGSTASYRLAVQASVQRIRVRVGDQPWQAFSNADVGAGRVVELR